MHLLPLRIRLESFQCDEKKNSSTYGEILLFPFPYLSFFFAASLQNVSMCYFFYARTIQNQTITFTIHDGSRQRLKFLYLFLLTPNERNRKKKKERKNSFVIDRICCQCYSLLILPFFASSIMYVEISNRNNFSFFFPFSFCRCYRGVMRICTHTKNVKKKRKGEREREREGGK